MRSPYAPPDTDPQGGTGFPEDPVAFSLSQRVGRLRFCCYTFTASLIMALGALLLAILAGGVMPELDAVFFLIMGAGGLFFALWYITLMIRRLHDMDRAGWWVLLMFVPLVNFLMWLWLLLGAPSSGPNRFGPPTAPNGLLVMVFGGIFWFFSVLSAVANIVMLVFLLVSPDRNLDFETWMDMEGLDPRSLEQLQQELE